MGKLLLILTCICYPINYINLYRRLKNEKCEQQVRGKDNKFRKTNQVKREQYCRRNNVELSGILNSICDEDLENTVIICKEPGIDVDTRDIEGCHQLPLSRNSRGHHKKTIVKFVNRKYAEAMLKDNKLISHKNVGHLNVINKVFGSVSLCPYYRYIWGKCKDLQRQG